MKRKTSKLFVLLFAFIIANKVLGDGIECSLDIVTVNEKQCVVLFTLENKYEQTISILNTTIPTYHPNNFFKIIDLKTKKTVSYIGTLVNLVPDSKIERTIVKPGNKIEIKINLFDYYNLHGLNQIKVKYNFPCIFSFEGSEELHSVRPKVNVLMICLPILEECENH